MAPISTATISACFREDRACISLASISFPVPFSPVMSILASVMATFSISWRSCCMALLAPQYMEEPDVFSSFVLFFFLFLVWVTAVCNVSTSFWLSQGFTIKSVAPSLMPRTARSISAYAVKSTTGRAGRSFLISCNQKRPSLPLLIPEVKFISRRTTSGTSSRSTAGRVTGEASVMTFVK